MGNANIQHDNFRNQSSPNSNATIACRITGSRFLIENHANICSKKQIRWAQAQGLVWSLFQEMTNWFLFLLVSNSKIQTNLLRFSPSLQSRPSSSWRTCSTTTTSSACWGASRSSSWATPSWGTSTRTLSLSLTTDPKTGSSRYAQFSKPTSKVGVSHATGVRFGDPDGLGR